MVLLCEMIESVLEELDLTSDVTVEAAVSRIKRLKQSVDRVDHAMEALQGKRDYEW